METDERNHKLVKVAADTTNKRVLLAIFLFGLALLVTIYVVAAFAIPSTFFYINGLSDCPDDFSTFKGFCHSFSLQDQNVWTSYLAGFNARNSFFVITGMAEREQGAADIAIDLELDFKAQIVPVDDAGAPLHKTGGLETARLHQFVMHCDADSIYCDEHGFVLYPRTDHKNYRISIELELDARYKSVIKGVRFFAKTQNPEYTKFLLAVRYTCLLISLLFGGWYAVFYCGVRGEYKTFEHKYILVLSVALLLFNDPIYAATIMRASTFLAILSALFVVSFVALLLFFWIVMVQRIHKESIRVGTEQINGVNVALGVAVFLMLAAIVCYSSIISRFDPGYHVEAEYPLAYQIVLIVVIAVFTLLLMLFFFNAYATCKAWNRVIPRYKFFFLFSFYFVLALFFLVVTGLYNATDFNGVRVLMLFVLFTFYVIVLQLMWRFDRGSQKHFIDIRNLDASNMHAPAGNRQRDAGLSYFDHECEIEITKAGGVMGRDDSVLTVEAGEGRSRGSHEFETAQFPFARQRSDVDVKMSFNHFQTSPSGGGEPRVTVTPPKPSDNVSQQSGYVIDYLGESERPVEHQQQPDDEPLHDEQPSDAQHQYRELDASSDEEERTRYEFGEARGQPSHK